MKMKTLTALIAVIALFAMGCGQTAKDKGESRKPEQSEMPAEAVEQTSDEQVEESAEGDAVEASEEAVEESGDSDAAEESEEAVKEEADRVRGNMPSGYPEKEFPVYNSGTSDVLGGFHQTIEGIMAYNLVIGTQDDVKTVSQKILETYKDKSEPFQNMNNEIFAGEKDGWEYHIVINSGEADGYGSVITYNLQKK